MRVERSMGKVRTTVRNWGLSGLLIAWMLGAGVPQGMGEEVSSDVDVRASRLAEIRERVEAAEELYRNFEVKFRVRTMRDLMNPAGRSGETLPVLDVQNQTTEFVIRQGGRFRVETESKFFRPGHKDTTATSLMVFDGVETRRRSEMMKSDELPFPANFVRWKGEERVASTLGPQKLLWNLELRYSGVDQVPLSVILGGHDAFVRYEPNRSLKSYLSNEYEIRVEYGGTEEIDGMICDRISIRWVSSKSSSWGSVVLWLVEERNSLPARIQFFSSGNAQNRSLLIGQTKEFQKVQEGVWYPAKCSLLSFRREGGDETGELQAEVVKELEVVEISLAPDYREDYFKLKVPEETPLDPAALGYEEIIKKQTDEKLLFIEKARKAVEENARKEDEIRPKPAGGEGIGNRLETLKKWGARKDSQTLIISVIVTLWGVAIAWRYGARRVQSSRDKPTSK